MRLVYSGVYTSTYSGMYSDTYSAADSTDARLYAHVYYAMTPVPVDWESYLK